MNQERTDAELISSAKAGDKLAFGELVCRYQRAAVRVAAMALGSATDADDVAQEAFVKAHTALGQFREEAAFRPWLFQIVVNTARTRHRRAGRQQALRQRIAGRAVIPTADPSEVAVHHDESARVVAAINRLAADDRIILTYRWYEALTEAEIAVAVDCRPGTVKSRLHRAMARLRTEMGVEVTQS